MAELRKYGVATTFVFPLIDRGALDFETTPVTFQNSDCQISKDQGAFANTGVTPAHVDRGIYVLSLSATEMEAARVSIAVIDITATKLWEDQAIIVDTYGNASAEHEFDLDLENPAIKGVAEAGTLSNTQMTTDLTEATDEHYNGRSVIWTSGVLQDQASDITAYLGSTGRLTYTAVTEAPSAADTFVIV